MKTITVFIEIPKGSNNKYEHDKDSGHIRLDRVLHSSMFYPADYGYIPETLSEDGDPSDVLVLTDSPTFPGCVVEARPIGVLHMTDEKGPDEKIIAVPVGNPHYSKVNTLEDVLPYVLDEIEHFFQQYKMLEDKAVEVGSYADAEEAIRLIEEAKTRYNESHRAS